MVAVGVDLGCASLPQLDEMIEASRRADRPARLHLKIDTGLSRGGATVADWPTLLEAAAKAGATWAAIVGEELREGRIGLKRLETGEQETVTIQEAAARIGG